MASSGYMTIGDVRSIWATALGDATRFGYINVRFGEILNFTCRKDKDATTDITETKVLPILEQISEEGLLRLIAASKLANVTNPWDFIQANVVSVMSKVLRDNRELIEEIKLVLETKVRLKFSSNLNLPSHSD